MTFQDYANPVYVDIYYGRGAKGGWGRGGRSLWFNLFYLVLGVRYQLGHCLVSTCNIYVILLYVFFSI